MNALVRTKRTVLIGLVALMLAVAARSATERSETPRDALRQPAIVFASRPFVVDQRARISTLRGRWECVADRRDGRFRGESCRSFTRDATATLAFFGRGIRIFGVVGPQGGTGRIAIDDRHIGRASFYATSKRTHHVVFASETLAPGRHVVLITVDAPSRAHRAYVNFDAIEVRA